MAGLGPSGEVTVRKHLSGAGLSFRDAMPEAESIETLSDPELLAERAPAYELAFLEAGRALDGQERAVNELRSRSSVLIAAAAITTSFFGGRAVVGDYLGVAVWIAIGAFALVGLAVLAVLWPLHDWQFSADTSKLVSEYIEPELLPLPLIHRDLALHRGASYVRNAHQLAWLFRSFRVGLILLVVEVSAWVVALAERS